MKEIGLEEMKKIQMDILTAVDKFCVDNNIRYSIEGGTLLGAVRHKGYIPWDDDIDICLLREDYNKLIRHFPELYKGCYSMKCVEKDSTYSFAYANICDERTILFQGGNTKPMGISIDVFPVDDVPDTEDEWLKYKKRIIRISNMRNTKVLKFRKGRKLYKNVILAVSKILLFPLTLKSIIHTFDKLAQCNNGKGYKWVYETCFGIYGYRPYEKTVFDELVDYPFEDRKFKGFKKYDHYLTCTYGSDYMTPPPVEQQVTHHAFKAYWK